MRHSARNDSDATTLICVSLHKLPIIVVQASNDWHIIQRRPEQLALGDFIVGANNLEGTLITRGCCVYVLLINFHDSRGALRGGPRKQLSPEALGQPSLGERSFPKIPKHFSDTLTGLRPHGSATFALSPVLLLSLSLRRTTLSRNLCARATVQPSCLGPGMMFCYLISLKCSRYNPTAIHNYHFHRLTLHWSATSPLLPAALLLSLRH